MRYLITLFKEKKTKTKSNTNFQTKQYFDHIWGNRDVTEVRFCCFIKDDHKVFMWKMEWDICG